MRREFRPGATHLDTDWLDDADIPALCGVRDATSLIQRVDEDSSAAVHDRHFGIVDIDLDIVDAEREERSHQMLDGCNRAVRRLAKEGAKIGRADLGGYGTDGDRFTVGNPVEDDPGVRICGMESNRHILA